MIADTALLNSVVPTLVGVNRVAVIPWGDIGSCPHARGGEPHLAGDVHAGDGVVPTLVGVNHLIADTALLNSIVVPTLVGVNRRDGKRLIRHARLSPRSWG